MRALVFAIVLSAFSLAASAGTNTAPKPLQLEEVITQQQQIRSDVMTKNGRYAKMPETKREELLSKQSQLLKMFEGKQSADELTTDQRMQAFNTLEWIEATINNEDDNRMVCTRERTIGSNRVTRVCRTPEQVREARERARDQMMDRGACGDASCLGG